MAQDDDLDGFKRYNKDVKKLLAQLKPEMKKESEVGRNPRQGAGEKEEKEQALSQLILESNGLIAELNSHVDTYLNQRDQFKMEGLLI